MKRLTMKDILPACLCICFPLLVFIIEREDVVSVQQSPGIQLSEQVKIDSSLQSIGQYVHSLGFTMTYDKGIFIFNKIMPMPEPAEFLNAAIDSISTYIFKQIYANECNCNPYYLDVLGIKFTYRVAKKTGDTLYTFRFDKEHLQRRWQHYMAYDSKEIWYNYHFK